MAVKGVLVTLSDDPILAGAALQALRLKPGIELGELQDKWLPLVLETEDEGRSKELVKWVEGLEGVYFLDTVFASVGEGDPGEPFTEQIPKQDK
ncbi:MAG: hypothetical protein AB3N63_04400 [Puniceicoccaceae bacterium]